MFYDFFKAFGKVCMKTHKDLDVWKKSVDFVTDVYQITNTFPNHELYGIVNQIRRAAVSIPSNIAEGAARKHKKEFVHYLHVALGSMAELETQLIISQKLNYLDEKKFTELNGKLNLIRRELIGLIKYLTK